MQRLTTSHFKAFKISVIIGTPFHSNLTTVDSHRVVVVLSEQQEKINFTLLLGHRGRAIGDAETYNISF